MRRGVRQRIILVNLEVGFDSFPGAFHIKTKMCPKGKNVTVTANGMVASRVNKIARYDL